MANEQTVRVPISLEVVDSSVKNIQEILNRIKSFEGLFKDCVCIESINFKKFKRNNINNMKLLF